jgi:hypothetical protein
MTPESFDQSLREWTRRKPFFPFVVEKKDRTRIIVAAPGVAFGGGCAGFLSEEDGLVNFNWDEVVAFRPYSLESTTP